MYGYQVKEDSEGIYYTLECRGGTFYTHRFSFPNRQEAHSAAFDHMMLRAYWHGITGSPEHIYNGRK